MEPLEEVELCKGALFEIGVVGPQKSPKDGKTLRNREELEDGDLPTEPKRRKMNGDTSSTVSSRSDSPSFNPEWWDESRSSTPGGSPAPRTMVEFKKRYRKDELWRAIESHYQYLMGKEIIETCRSTESDLSLDDDDFVGNPNFSLTEFLQQYRELTEWLNQIQLVTQRHVMSLSEQYLNQSYHEEMLERSPRRKFFNEYAKQLLRRYPHMKDEIGTRMTFLNNQWQEVEAAISPKYGYHKRETMIKDLESDFSCLRKWINKVEGQLLPLTIKPEWSNSEVEDKLKEHQILQREIESRSKVVSAVVKLSQHLENDKALSTSDDRDSLSRIATNLEHRWHGIWLQSLEWQCRLEEALNRQKGNHGATFSLGKFNLSSLEESYNSDYGGPDVSSSSFGGDFKDDSLLYLGLRNDRVADTPNRLDISQHNILRKSSFFDKSSGDSANISEAESKMGDSLPSMENADLAISQSSDGEGDVLRRFLAKHENKDIGYSSESHSNDEVELMRLQSVMENKYPGKCEVASDTPLSSRRLNGSGIKKDYYRMVSVDVDTTDKTDNDDGTDTVDIAIPSVVDDFDTVTAREEVSEETSERVLNQSSISSERFEQGIECIESLLAQSSELSEESSGETKDKIRFLIDQAEDLVRQSPKATRTSTPGKFERKFSPPKQTRSIGCNTVVLSSCDASGEDNSDNESSNEEFSTATDDAGETLFDSVICLDYTSDSRNASQENVCLFPSSPLVLDNVKLRNQIGSRRLKDRPWSFVEMQEFSQTLETQPFSTSESAIDRIAHNLGDNDANTPPSAPFLQPNRSSTFPRERPCSRGFQRSFSTSDQSSPRGAKRKLRYSTQHNSILSETMNASKLVPSTDSEDDVTKHISETDDMVSRFELTHVKSSSGGSSCCESESETSDDYMTPPMEAQTSDNEDVLNSTGSFSENAWDNYQAPLYPTVSEDPTEERLHWEPSDEMEFDEDFHLFHCPSIVTDAISKKNVSDKRKAKLTVPAPTQYDDSDSDIDDFHYILDQSSQQLKIADHSLKKKRKDPMGTGLQMNPAKYSEIMATCVTNIRCLENVCQHLTGVAEDDCQRTQDLVFQWEKLRALASERFGQSTQLAVMYKSILNMRKKQKEIEEYLEPKVFSSAQELESSIKNLQEQQLALRQQKCQMHELEQTAEKFGSQYLAIPVGKFYEELEDIGEANKELQQSLSEQLCEQQNSLVNWYEYLEGCKELNSLLAQDRERLQKLLCHRDNGMTVPKKELLNEIESLQSSLSVYEAKLINMQSLHSELVTSSDKDTQREFLAALADIRNQLLVFTNHCCQTHRDVENEEETCVTSSDVGQLAVSSVALHECLSQRKISESEDVVVEIPQEPAYGTSRSWIQSCPLHLAGLVMLAGLIYLMDPDFVENLTSFSIKITPELKYVDGPPPV